MGKGTNRAYKVVPVDEDEPNFGDPPRNWGRAASMTGVWAVVLLAGAWMAPGFAAGGDEGEIPASEKPPADPNDAAWVYLTEASTGNLERAQEVLCEGADPEVSPNDIDQIRQGYSDEFGGITRIDVSTEDPTATGNGWMVESTISFVSDGRQAPENFTLTVGEHENGFCVANVVESEPEGSSESGDDREITTQYLTAIFIDRQVTAAEGFQCDNFQGLDFADLDSAISAWEAENGEAQRYLERGGTESAPQGAGTVFTYKVVFDALTDQAFEFDVTVSDGCVSSFEGGSALLAFLED